jgi:hypothetical protein
MIKYPYSKTVSGIPCMFVDNNGCIEVTPASAIQRLLPDRIVQGAPDEASALKNAEVVIAALLREENAVRHVNGPIAAIEDNVINLG